MKFGVCGDVEVAVRAQALGYDFAEWNVAGLLQPRAAEAEFERGCEAVRGRGVRYAVLNCFVPGDLKITGPEADLGRLCDYVGTVFARARRAGVETIVFGSGGARRVPEGWPAERAWAQLVEFGAMLAPLAQAQGVTVVVEPLNRVECNVLNTVRESAELVRAVSHPHLRLLVDAFHLLRDGDAVADVERFAPLLAHVHIATEAHRLAPAAEPCDFKPFFDALARGGYKGRVSIEATIRDPAVDLPAALAEMKRLAPADDPARRVPPPREAGFVPISAGSFFPDIRL